MSRILAYNLLHKNMFSADFIANDYFSWGSQCVSIANGDFEWVVDHIEKYGQDGLDACLAYIQNQKPLEKFLTDNFNIAINELVSRNQIVKGDIDYDFYHYETEGPYRTINKDF